MKDLYRGKKQMPPSASLGFSRVNSQTRTFVLLPACAGCLLVIAAKNQMPPSASLVFARVNSQTRTVGALPPAFAGCLLVIAAKNQMPPSASLVFLLAYIIS